MTYVCAAQELSDYQITFEGKSEMMTYLPIYSYAATGELTECKKQVRCLFSVGSYSNGKASCWIFSQKKGRELGWEPSAFQKLHIITHFYHCIGIYHIQTSIFEFYILEKQYLANFKENLILNQHFQRSKIRMKMIVS